MTLSSSPRQKELPISLDVDAVPATTLAVELEPKVLKVLKVFKDLAMVLKELKAFKDDRVFKAIQELVHKVQQALKVSKVQLVLVLKVFKDDRVYRAR
jgi:hypothetical protein